MHGITLPHGGGGDETRKEEVTGANERRDKMLNYRL